MKTLLEIIALSIVIFALAFAIVFGAKQSEIVHCNKLVSQSEEFAQAGFYITSIEKDMCDAHGIAINAPVK